MVGVPGSRCSVPLHWQALLINTSVGVCFGTGSSLDREIHVALALVSCLFSEPFPGG